jgi:site-specific DNA-methyltransferase (adenine-specific)
MEFMRDKPDNYWELAIVDPPYGINFAKTHTGNGWIVRENKEWDKNIPDKNYFNELFRVTKNQIIWGGNYFVKHLFHSQGWIVWDKGQRNFSLADGELAFTSFSRALRIFTYTRGKMQSMEKNKFHPTMKPVKLYEWLLENYANKGDKILDTHGGSMSSVIACINMQFDIDCCELDKDYFESAVKRIQHHASQLDMFRQQPIINIERG